MNNVKIMEEIEKVDVELSGEGAALYLRVTREESIKKGLSLPNQKNRGLEVAAQRKWNWVKIYEELNPVGGDVDIDGRKALRELVDDLKSGKIRHVFARHTDRFWRSSEVRDQLLKIFRVYEIELWDFDSKKDFLTAEGKFVLKVNGDVSEFEKDRTAERIREMKRGKAKAGRPAGGPPTYGYISQKRLRRELILQKGLDEEQAYQEACSQIPNAHEWFIDPAEREVVIFVISAYIQRHPQNVSIKDWKDLEPECAQKILAMYENVKQPLGGRGIATILNKYGYRRRSGEAWVGSKVLRIVNDPVIFGYLTYDEVSYAKKKPSSQPKHKQTFFKAMHEPIINPNLWTEIQALKEKKTVSLRTKNKVGKIFPLSHILHCGKCGSPMKARSQGKDRPFAYYVCRRRVYYGIDITHNSKACNFPAINANQAEHAIWEWLTDLASRPDLVNRIWEKTNQRIITERPESQLSLDQKKKELEKVETTLQKYYLKYENAKNQTEEELAWNKLIEFKQLRQQVHEVILSLEEKVSYEKPISISQDDVNHYVRRMYTFLNEYKNKRRTLYQLLQTKHQFKVIAHAKYCIEPQFNFFSGSNLFEIDPAKYPPTEETHPNTPQDILSPELAYSFAIGQDSPDGHISNNLAYRTQTSASRRPK